MIKIITDSAADIPKQEVAEYGIEVLPIPVTVDGKTYMEGVDFDEKTFYKMLKEAKELPTTSQVTALRYCEAYKKAVDEGYDEIACITITAKGSGMFDAARIGRDFFYEENPEYRETVRIEVIDSESYTYDYGHAVVSMAKAIKKGRSFDDSILTFHHRRNGYQVYFGITNLEYAKKSGRISSAAAFVGEIMGFRPVMTLHNGGTDTIGKVRGDNKLLEELVKIFKERYTMDDRGFYIVYNDNKEMGVKLRKAIEKETGARCRGEYRIGASVTINAGPTVFGVIIPVTKVK